MDLEELYNLINFYVNKAQGGWYSPGELDLIVDRAQITLFNRYYTVYATSQRLVDALGPFKTEIIFTTLDNGLVATSTEYMNLLSIYTLVQDVDNVTRPKPVKIILEDELPIRLNSQVCPVTVSSPVAVMLAGNVVQLYPVQVHTGRLTYLRRPRAPFFSYSLVSGRVIAYDPDTSTQLQWSEKEYKSIALIALEELGINLSEQEIVQWSAAKDQQNFMTNMKQ